MGEFTQPYGSLRATKRPKAPKRSYGPSPPSPILLLNASCSGGTHQLSRWSTGSVSLRPCRGLPDLPSAAPTGRPPSRIGSPVESIETMRYGRLAVATGRWSTRIVQLAAPDLGAE